MSAIPEDSYCHAAASDPLHRSYHDTEYGFPLRSDDELFERLLLEINQAGLAWLTILKKREGMREAYDGFSVDAVAGYGDADRQRLLSDPRVIRNRLKVEAAVTNARAIQEIREGHGSFAAWLDAHHPMPKGAWVKLFKDRFRFTGGEITGEFLMSTGYLPGAHHQACPVYEEIAELGPPWMTRRDAG